MHLKNIIKHPFRPVWKLILATVITVSSSYYAKAQEGNSPSGNPVFEWMELNGSINDIAPGEYIVLFREVNSTVISDTVDFTIELKEKPIASINASNEIICAGDSVTLNSALAESYLWSTGDTTQSIIVEPTVNTTYSLTISQNGCISNEASIEIVVNELPNIEILRNKVACAGQTVDLTAAEITNNADLTGLTLSYWQGPEPYTELDDPTAVSTTDIYYLKIENENACSQFEWISVLFNSLPEFTLSNITAASYLGASDGSITITNNDTEDLLLNFNDKQTTLSSSLTIDTLSAGEYYLVATNTDDCNSDTLKFSITEPQTFTFAAHITQNETTSGAGDGVVVIDTIYASKALNVEVSLDKGATWSPIVQGDSIKNLPADSVYVQLKAGEILSEIQGFYILEGCEAPVFSVIDLTACGEAVGTVSLDGLEPTEKYEYVLIPKSVFSKPVITLLGDNPVHIGVGSTYEDAGATAYDTQFGDLTSSITTVNNVDPTTAGSYIINYNVTNPNGIAADELVRTVIVEDEVSSIFPVDITFYTHDYNGVSDQNIACGFDFNSASTIYTINAVQETPESMPEFFITSGENRVDISGRYTMHAFGIYPNGEMLIIDINNGVLDFNTQTYFNNISCPPISAHNLTVTNGSGSGSYLPGNSIEIVANTPQEGSEFAAWTGDVQYLDDPSNSTAHVTMPNSNVNVEATYREISGGSPVVTILGDNPLTWILGEIFVDPGANAYDEKDGDITSSIIASNNVNTDMAGTYYVNYNVVDSDGYAAEEKTRTVNVLCYLTVTNGTGTGNYTAGSIVEITANSPAPGYQFKEWAGDIQYINNSLLSTTNVTIPLTENVSVTATYELIPPPEDAMVMRFVIPSDNYTLTIPFYNTSGYNCQINWKDGSEPSFITSSSDADRVHVYSTAGTYDIEITGTMKGIYFNNGGNKLQLTEIIQWGDVGIITYRGAFYGCSNLELIPNSPINYVRSISDFSYMFSNCNISVIPDGFFDNCINIGNIDYIFMGNPISSIPIGLFDNMVNIASFEGVFARCSSFTTIPSGLFDNNINATSFRTTFSGCSLLTSIPSGLFDHNVNVTNFGGTFSSCLNLTTIPHGLFDNNIKVTDFTIPNGGNINSVYTNGGTFSNCPFLTEIPDNLFINNTQVQNINCLFSFCTGITTIPSGLFDSFIGVTTCIGTFQRCSSITSIPNDLFYNCVNVIKLANTFEGCTSISSIPENLFINNVNIDSFSRTFLGCYNLTGNAPDLWNQFPSAYGTACFYGAKLLTNYTSIPSTWK